MKEKIKLAIIGASYLQEPLITKAKNRGIETHVFAWECGDIGERIADYFYPISIVEKEQILEKCREIGIDGICTIASDLATIPVNYVANRLGLIGNSDECTLISTNKREMRKAFYENGDPSPKSTSVKNLEELDISNFKYPIIVKPSDRSGSRGITKLNNDIGLEEAFNNAKKHSFEKTVVIEEFFEGKEYSVEFISFEGEHHFLTITEKFTTGAPGFIETGHFEPAPLTEALLSEVKNIVKKALNSLKVKNGASHSEVKINDKGEIKIIEIGARMGGDMIGSSLVELSTGYDFVNGVIDVALGIKPKVNKNKSLYSAIRFVFNQNDVDVLNVIKQNCPEILIFEDIQEITDQKITNSADRFGCYIICSDDRDLIRLYLPEEC